MFQHKQAVRSDHATGTEDSGGTMSALLRSASDATISVRPHIVLLAGQTTHFPEPTITNPATESQGHLCISIDISFTPPNINPRTAGIAGAVMRPTAADGVAAAKIPAA